MIRSFLFIVFFFIACSSHAQVRFGVQAGYNSAKWDYTITPGNWETSTDDVSGFNVGGLAMLDLRKHIVVQGGLLFNSGGTTLKHRYRFSSSSRKIKLYSLNLPVTARYTFYATNLRFGVGGGFYAAMFLSGTEKGATELFIINGPPQIQTVDNKVEFGDREFEPGSAAAININRFDAGYILNLTSEFKDRWVVQISIMTGFREVLPGYSFSGNFKNEMVSMSLAVLLTRRK